MGGSDWSDDYWLIFSDWWSPGGLKELYNNFNFMYVISLSYTSVTNDLWSHKQKHGVNNPLFCINRTSLSVSADWYRNCDQWSAPNTLIVASLKTHYTSNQSYIACFLLLLSLFLAFSHKQTKYSDCLSTCNTCSPQKKKKQQQAGSLSQT